MLDTIGGWLFAIALFWGLLYLFSIDQDNLNKRVKTYSNIHNCRHIGYAGKFNGNKMYKCDNGIILDREMF